LGQADILCPTTLHGRRFGIQRPDLISFDFYINALNDAAVAA